MRLVFPIVVFTRDGLITPVSAFLHHFGVEVRSLDDLPNLREGGQHSADISRLVEEVEKTGMPSKRNLLIHPRMSAQVYHCSLYAVLPMDRIGITLGLIIHESWPRGESAAGSDGSADLSR